MTDHRRTIDRSGCAGPPGVSEAITTSAGRRARPGSRRRCRYPPPDGRPTPPPPGNCARSTLSLMELTGALQTDSGMCVLWDRGHFVGVRDYPSWETELLEDVDIERHIVSGHLVPINIGSDGVFVVAVRADVA